VPRRSEAKAGSLHYIGVEAQLKAPDERERQVVFLRPPAGELRDLLAQRGEERRPFRFHRARSRGELPGERDQTFETELVALARGLIDADEALSAEHEARSIAEELAKDAPDETVLIRKIKGFVSRLSLTFSGTADLASKGEMIGEFAERLAAWLVALSIWTEWHAAHHPVPDPCA